MSSGERDELLLLPMKRRTRKPAGAMAQRDGGVASNHKVPLSTCSETHLDRSLELAFACSKTILAGGAENSYFARHAGDAGSNPAMRSNSHVAKWLKAPKVCPRLIPRPTNPASVAW